jgi:diadenosine tetraphosphate (Ap4A) HIT family hydrolase
LYLGPVIFLEFVLSELFMTEFKLNERLKNDCFVLGRLKFSQLLLLNNSLVPWFILVPETNVFEFYELDIETQHLVLEEINELSNYIKEEFIVDKLNIATIGNIVQQLHIHVIGRSENDYCWPGVVWGAEGKQEYSEIEVANIAEKITNKILSFKIMN